jgi:hypothetical protein
MARIEETLDKSADRLSKASILIRNGKEVASYWNPLDNSKRERAKSELKKLKWKTRWLYVRYLVLWILIILFTWVNYSRV